MTQPKFKIGDKVKTAAGLESEIAQINTGGTAALVHAGKGDTFEASWYSTGSLKKPGRAKKPETTADAEDTGSDDQDGTDESQDDSE